MTTTTTTTIYPTWYYTTSIRFTEAQIKADLGQLESLLAWQNDLIARLAKNNAILADLQEGLDLAEINEQTS